MFQYRLPTKGQAQRTDRKTICHGMDSLWLQSCPWLPTVPRWLSHWATLGDWQQGCAGTGLQHHSNPLLWEGKGQQRLLRPNLPCCPGIQLHTQLSPNLQHRSEILEVLTTVTNRRACASHSPAPQALYNVPLGSRFHRDLGMQLAGLRRLSAHVIHHS